MIEKDARKRGAKTGKVMVRYIGINPKGLRREGMYFPPGETVRLSITKLDRLTPEDMKELALIRK